AGGWTLTSGRAMLIDTRGGVTARPPSRADGAVGSPSAPSGDIPIWVTTRTVITLSAVKAAVGRRADADRARSTLY
ncbi:MAG: hypothetical protein ABI474_06330, partial [Actinomycetota bacterium]